jgi:hypothetical protein
MVDQDEVALRFLMVSLFDMLKVTWYLNSLKATQRLLHIEYFCRFHQG